MGHAIPYMILRRLSLSLVHSLYELLGRWKTQVSTLRLFLSDAHRAELLSVAVVVPLLRVCLRQPVSTTMIISDSSETHYCGAVGQDPYEDIRDAFRWDERWRFLPQYSAPLTAKERELEAGVARESVQIVLDQSDRVDHRAGESYCSTDSALPPY